MDFRDLTRVFWLVRPLMPLTDGNVLIRFHNRWTDRYVRTALNDMAC